jgi:hypothetical protein
VPEALPRRFALDLDEGLALPRERGKARDAG